jgi:phospholipid N-methyltransferase
MNDLERMEKFYNNKIKDEWSLFNCYPFFLDCKQTYIMTKILNTINLKESTFLDIGAGEGNFILKMISLGLNPNNIMAVEYLKHRYDLLHAKLPNIKVINDDFLNVKNEKQYDIVMLMAVLTSITDNEMRYNILEKALTSISEDGMLILYDYFDDEEKFLTENYRCLSLSKVRNILHKYDVKVYKNVYIKSKYAKGLCKFGLESLIPLLQSLKIFNDSYCFVVIKNEK